MRASSDVSALCITATDLPRLITAGAIVPVIVAMRTPLVAADRATEHALETRVEYAHRPRFRSHPLVRASKASARPAFSGIPLCGGHDDGSDGGDSSTRPSARQSGPRNTAKPQPIISKPMPHARHLRMATKAQ
jgi:hypothetical protein